MMLNARRFILALLSSCQIASLSSQQMPAQQSPDPSASLRIRVGAPRVVRGPSGIASDSTFTETQLPGGKFRGFTGTGMSAAIDGNAPWDMSAPGVTVLKAGPAGSSDSCGQWLQHVEKVGNQLLGWVHNETACNYNIGQTHMSMVLATSNDNGLTWTTRGRIIGPMSNDLPSAGVMSGDTCLSAMRGNDGFYYCYGLRARKHQMFVARAPVSDPSPGNWKKYFNGDWSQPGVGGDATLLGNNIRPAHWISQDMEVGVDWGPKGITLAFSADRLHFTDLPQPILTLDTGSWNRKADSAELLAYETLIDARTGENQLSDHWLMAYMYLQPGEGFDKRYLVFRPIDVTWGRKPDEPQSAVALARWYNAKLHDRWSTVAPVPGNYNEYQLEAVTGYLLSTADPSRATVELEDCVAHWASHPDHLLSEKGFCESHSFQRLRTAGWIYAQPQPDTVPLYRCHNATEQFHFASNDAQCEKLGTPEKLLGYALKQ
jgi:hypothetical protein